MNCPKCGAEMVLRTANQGTNKGNKFWGCSMYHKTKCNGTIPYEASNQIQNNDSYKGLSDAKTKKYKSPLKLNSRSLYEGFNTKYFQTIGIPMEVMNTVNNEGINRDDIIGFSKFRIDYKISENDSAPLHDKSVLQLARKILTRGRLTLISPKIETDMKTYFKIDTLENFDLNIYYSFLSSQSKHKSFDLFDSSLEKHFYFEELEGIFGSLLYSHVTPQVYLDSLCSNVTALSNRRVDFLVHGRKKDYIIELDGLEHLDHVSRDTHRDNQLISEGYEIVRIENDNIGDSLKQLLTGIKPNIDLKPINISSIEKCMYSIHIAHRIEVSIIELLLSGCMNNSFSIKLNKSILNTYESKALLKSIEKDINEFLTNISSLSGKTFDNPLKVTNYSSKDLNSFNIFIEEEIDNPNATDVARIGSVFTYFDIFQETLSDEINFYKNPTEDDLKYFLNYIFRKEAFRSRQFHAIRRALMGLDTLVLLPTGAGKSIAFQLSALLLNGVSLVIDPIISLINDQIDNLQRIGIDRVGSITSEVADKDLIQEEFQNSAYLLTYIAPERLQMKSFRDVVRGLILTTAIPLIAIDEAHCVSEWGHDFRTSYLNIGRITRDHFVKNAVIPCIIGLTGTASNSVLKDVQRELGITDFEAIITPESFDRKELTYDVVASESDQKNTIIANILKRKLPNFFGIEPQVFFEPMQKDTLCGIVFCPHVNGDFGTFEVMNSIRKNVSPNIDMYSGEKPKKIGYVDWNNYKSDVAKKFKNDKVNCLIATKSFGMGIDKPNIWYTVHYGLPSSIESFYQEAGRAGRANRNDDKIKARYARCILIGSVDNPIRARKLLNPSANYFEVEELYKNEVTFENSDDITRALYFHLSSFKGIPQELNAIKHVLSYIVDINKSGRINVSIRKTGEDKKQNLNEERTLIEKAIYRLLLLGVIGDYTIDYSNNEFQINYQGIDKYQVIDAYALYVSGYSRLRVNRETEIMQQYFDLSEVDFLIKACETLVSFIYDTVEKGKRRALNEAFLMFEEASKSSNPDSTIRGRILNYLQTTYSEEIERILNEDNLQLKLIRDLIEGHENNRGDFIGGLRSTLDAEELRGQVSRYLESNPDQPVLLILRAISEMFSNDTNLDIVDRKSVV